MKALKSIHHQIAKYTGEGFSSKETGVMLGMSAKTVENYRGVVFRFYRCHNAVQLAHRLLQNGKIQNIYQE